jgi:hypothetical protein
MEPRVTTSVRSLSPISQGDQTPESPYKKRFRNGAQLQPRMLMFVDELASGPLGVGMGRVRVRSRRNTQEKSPWKELPSLEGVVERAFVRDVFLGETVVPYGLLRPLRAVLPIATTSSELLNKERIEQHEGLASWWLQANQLRDDNKKNFADGDLTARVDYHGQLSAQLPMATHRVLYSASGNAIAAARVESSVGVVEHKLYWAPVGSREEARYLTAVLNSGALLSLVTKFQNVGLFGPRDFDKNVFRIPFPAYDGLNQVHIRLAGLAGQAELISEQTIAMVGSGQDFKMTRNQVRVKLQAGQLLREIDKDVSSLLKDVSPES